MAEYVPLSKSTHRESGLVPAGYSHALEQAIVPLVAEELAQVLPTMVTGFVQSAGGNGFELVALQSLQAGVNVYVHTNGRWIGGYRPAWYRTHPLQLLRDEQSERYVVCVDEAAQAFEKHASDKAVKLFDDHGELTERSQNTVTFLEKLHKATGVTRELVNQLEQVGIIVPWQLTNRKPGREAGEQVQGLYHIDEAALKTLEPDVLARLAKSGALSVAYTQLLSEHRLQGLSRLYDLRSQANKQAKPADDIDLEDLFSDDDDGDLSFN